MNVLSLFDGMSCGLQALKNIGINPTKYFASEIDKYAITIAKKNHPEIIHIGDVTKINTRNGNLLIENKEYKIDLLIGGSPCQGFSFAGKQLNFNDPRSALFFEFVRLKNELSPKHFLLENVKMKKESENIITEYMGVSPIEINSSLVSAQNRKRLYWTNLSIPHIKESNIQFKDIMENNALNVYRLTPKMLTWINKNPKRVSKLKIYDNNSDCKMQMLEASHCKGISNQRCFLIKDPLTARLVGRRFNKDGVREDYNTEIKIEQTIEINEFNNKTNCLTTVLKDNVILDADLSCYRYISVIECERLQTLPDNYTEGVSNTQRYKMLGNGWTVKVIEYILNGLI